MFLNVGSRISNFEIRSWELVALLLLLAGPVLAQDDHRLAMVKVHDRIVIDGVLDEKAWDSAPMATGFVQQDPKEGMPMTYDTEVKMLYDDENLYVGVRALDPEANRILVNDITKDFRPFDSDVFGVIVDTFRDRKNGYEFLINPAGGRYDAQTTNESEFNANWDGVWYLQTKILDDAWIAEMAIPFKTLRFFNLPEQTWGINFWRVIRRFNEQGHWSHVPRPFNYARLSLAGTAEGLKDIQPGVNLRVKPYVVGSASSRADDDANWDADAGIDIKYGFGGGITLDATVNTDFSQVEADEQQINLTRFNLFFPEKREFFLENSGIFAFGELGQITSGGGGGTSSPGRLSGGGNDMLFFFSRRIGISDDGRQIPVLGGARLTGRKGPWSFGFLNIATHEARPTPATNFTVARIRRNILANSQVGAVLINKDELNSGGYNRGYGADANLRFGRSLNVSLFYAKTDLPGVQSQNDAYRLSAAFRNARWDFRSIYTDIGSSFKPEVGFAPRTGVKRLYHLAAVKLRPASISKHIREIAPTAEEQVFWTQASQMETRFVDFRVPVIFQDGALFEAGRNANFERLFRPFSIQNSVQIQPADYTFTDYFVSYRSSQARRFGVNLKLQDGAFYDGDKKTYVAGGTVRFGYRMATTVTYTRNDIRLPQSAFNTDLVAVRVNYSFSTRAFLSALLQYNTDARQWSSNVRFNVIHRPLSDFFIVYNERRDTVSSSLIDRALIVKFTHMIGY
jgi:hypothetical protein